MGIFSNYLMQVSGPMGSIQKDLETKQRDIERLEQDIRDLRESSNTESVVPVR
jgi:archaellum component FlaC